MHHELYYEGEYLAKHPTWHAEDSSWKAAQILRILCANDVRPNTICEVGCGAGEILRQLKAEMPLEVQLFGYEISPQAYNLAVGRATEGVSYYNRDLLEEKKAFFDLLLCIDVFEHVEDCFSLLRSLREKAEWKIFHIPLDLSVQSVLRSGRLLKDRRDYGHIHAFTKELALELLLETGYTVIDSFYTATSIELETASGKRVLAIVPRKLLARFNPDLAARLLGGFSLLVLAK